MSVRREAWRQAFRRNRYDAKRWCRSLKYAVGYKLGQLEGACLRAWYLRRTGAANPRSP